MASNRRISQFLSSVLRHIIEQAEELCESTEDMLSRIQHCNETEMLSSSVVGSMDVKALYPSIDIDFAVEKCVELMQESNVKFNNVDVDELGWFLMTTCDKKDIEGQNLINIVHLVQLRRE